MVKSFAVFLTLILSCSGFSQEGPEFVVQMGHTAPINAAIFHSNGKYIITAGSDNLVKIWEIDSEKEMRTFQGHTDVVRSAVLSIDGKSLISSSADKTIKVWDLVTGRLLKTLEGHISTVRSVAISSSGKYILSGAEDYTVKLWDSDSGKELYSFENHSNSVFSVGFNPEGNIGVSASADKSIRLWDLDSKKELKTLKGHTDFISSAKFSHDGRYVVSGSYDKTIKLWDISTGQEIKTFIGHLSKVLSVCFSPDDRFILSGSSDNFCKLWDIKSGKEIRTFSGHAGWVNSVSFNQNASYILTASSDNTARLWDTKTSQVAKIFMGHSAPINSIDFSKDGKFLAIASSDKTAKLWDLAVGKQIRTFIGHNYAVKYVRISQNGAYLLTAGEDRIAKLWDLNSGKDLRSFIGHKYSVNCVDFSPDLTCVVTGSSDKTIKIWELKSGREIKTLQGHRESVTSVQYNSAGDLILTASNDNTAKLWDVNKGEAIQTFYGHSSSVNSAQFSYDEKYIVTTSSDKTIKIWGTDTGSERMSYISTGTVINAIFGPDGNTVFSASSNGDIQTWGFVTETLIHKFQAHLFKINTLQFSPDGEYFISGSNDHTLKVWNTKDLKQLATIVPVDLEDWVVVSSTGNFDASASGVGQISYVQGMDILPLESFYENFFSPRLLGTVLSKDYAKALLNVQKDKSNDKAIAKKGESSQLSKDETLNLSIIDFARKIKLPPLARITIPQQESDRHKKGDIEILIDAIDQGGGIGEVRLFHNGKLVSEDKVIQSKGFELDFTDSNRVRIKAKEKQIQKTYRLKLIHGTNEFVATALNLERTEGRTLLQTVEFTGQKTSTNLYVLTVGINNYSNPGLKLNYGIADASSFGLSIEKHSKELFGSIKKYELYDEFATRPEIENVFKTVSSEASEEDVFVFYFAGHGVVSKNSDQNLSEFFLLPSNIDKLHKDFDDLTENGISATLLKTMCVNIRSLKQVIILDACQSGAVAESFQSETEKLLSRSARNAGVVLFASANYEQYAVEFSELGHGAFTYALLRAIEGDADFYPDGKITINEINMFLSNKVPEITEKFRGERLYPYSLIKGQDFILGLK